MRVLKKIITAERSPLKVDLKAAILGFIGGFIVIFSLIILTEKTEWNWIMAPFGASCVLAFGVWDAPLSQPRNIIGGHFISTFIGLACQTLFGNSAASIAVAVGLAIMCMMLTKTTHPPAGADPLVVMMSQTGWNFLFTPVLVGSLVIVIIALIINNLNDNRKYPTFWL
ncbi:HPP family protein [Enterococcus silesiacus]|uniref:HPP family protein n=1 Tax=Enterococcus silesiacus TaxID=332949 RepID=UPI000B19345D|nr:HPP family protein [Enterococcus silesiacus]